MASNTNKRGTHAELVAMTALLAAGYEVAEPVAAETYDLVAKEPGTGEWRTFQVKTLRYRDDKGGAGGYYVLNGTRNNGETYEPGAVDYMIGVLGNVCYLVECTGQSEYWAAADAIDGKWRKLTVSMNEAEAV
ncbi:group I intron-associated PD-(D/E)XK endonuclease [Brevibacillus sp. WF146]|uniref:group I intron-associated PD-(D/E)XK endonuclease n=1 Tax=Brevibacillus sp. WF146 TaxID=319501 RepID=UPI0007ED81EA|nr:group I intron-associated PD-(D/E)XK endonuclease [Brevibacillus sp. WF146]UYZ12173.1 group I intron-associated PD-(D/E)XK endonuclease [Brevibacillus sp. WF146]